MGGFYSFRVYAPHEVTIPENFLYIDEGMATFNVHVNCIDSFLERLKSADVRVDQMHHLDAVEPVSPMHWLEEGTRER
jgi:hypothetical protein